MYSGSIAARRVPLDDVSPFSSVFSVVFLNFFHHDANSRLEGGEAADGEGAGAPRCPD